MKKLFSLLALTFVLSATVSAQDYAERVRNYVREKLVFYYVHDPTQPRPADMSTIEIDKNAIAEGRDIDSPVWTDARNRGLRQLLAALLRRPGGSGADGNFRLQRAARDALMLTNKPVIVYLYNDKANGIPHTDWDPVTNNQPGIYCQYDDNDNTKNQCWPCASRFNDRTKSATGHMALGAFYFDPAPNRTIEDANQKLATFLHELVHTQVQMVKESSVSWANWYGAPGSGHYGIEILPSKNTAFNEGVATAFAYRFHHPDDEKVDGWFTNNRRMWVDSIGGCGTGGAPSYRCIIDRMQAAGQTGVRGTLGGRPGRIYNIRTVPPDILVHNETVLANMIYEYTRQFRNSLMLVRDLKRAQVGIGATTGDDFTFTPLFREIMKSSDRFQPLYAPETQRPQGSQCMTGIVDFYLGYRMNDRATLENAFGFTWSDDLPNIDDYFTTHRAVLHGFRPNTTTWAESQLRQFAEHLNVRRAAPTPAAGGDSTNNNQP